MPRQYQKQNQTSHEDGAVGGRLVSFLVFNSASGRQVTDWQLAHDLIVSTRDRDNTTNEI